MVRNGKEPETLDFLRWPATFEKASTYVFAGRLIRNAEVRGSTPLCSNNNSHNSNNLATAIKLGPFRQLANTWPEKTTVNSTELYAITTDVKRAVMFTSAII